VNVSSASHDETWRTCFKLLAPRLLLFARQWVHSRADAEDVVQTAFVRFWRKQPEPRTEHYPLLYAAVRSVALDLRRKDERRSRRETSSRTEIDAQPFFYPTLEADGDAALVSATLQRLPEAQREVLVLRIWGELTFAEIATALGESINTVAARYRYGLEALRKQFKPQQYERV
jgi:RNA polymerase sigma-70 factor (ECF subfamily)